MKDPCLSLSFWSWCLIFTFSFVGNVTLAQDSELTEWMLQKCLSDSVFKRAVLSNSEFHCDRHRTYHFSYSQEGRVELEFNGQPLSLHDYKDSSLCSPFFLSYRSLSRSKYEVSVSLSVPVPLKCEHLEGHGHDSGCFSKK